MFDARDAVQLLLIALLNTKLADVIRAAVIAFVATVFYALFFTLIDASDVAHHVTPQLPIGIAAKQPGLDVDAWKTKTLRRKTRDFFIRQPRANRQ